MFDLDHFKHLNDGFGHAAGDEALCAFSAILRERCSAGDLVARVGGEEFAVVLFDADLGPAQATVDRIARSLAHWSLDRPTILTTSAGIALLGPDVSSPSEMLWPPTVRCTPQGSRSQPRRAIRRSDGARARSRRLSARVEVGPIAPLNRRYWGSRGQGAGGSPPTGDVMAARRPSPAAKQTRAAPAPSVGLSELSKDVHPLGQALKERAADVLELHAYSPTAIRRRRGGSEPVRPHQQTSTLALARWLAGEGAAVAREASNETYVFYGEFAAHRAASLKEVTMRCLAWRDAVGEVLRESAAQLAVPPAALPQALHILQHSTDFGLIRMAASFDSERQRTDEELAFMATHDALTGLPNRTLILDRVQQMLARGARTHAQVAALLVEIDNLKSVTDTLGHAAGDELLRAVGARLDGVVRGADALGCFGGAEFIVICEDLSFEVGPGPTAKRLLEALRPSFELGAGTPDAVHGEREHRDRGGRANLGRGAAAPGRHSDAPGQVGR